MNCNYGHRKYVIDSVCYLVEFEQLVEYVWKWKYVENGEGKTMPNLV